MSVHFISGKPGGGKTLYAMKLIIEELLHGSRPIYTNIPIIPGALSEYLQQKYPDRQIDLLNRIRLLNETETAKFWTIRPGNPTIPVLSAPEWTRGDKPKYENVSDAGVFYAIDEIHNFFNARAWQETGRDVLFYLSQHRKLGDTVICITQAIGNVDKQFRSVTQDFTYLRNLNKERMGLFRLPSVFVRRTFGEPATATSQALESGTFTLDVSGVASCYDTAQGVSIHGKGADLKERKTGINVWVFIIGLPAILIALVYFVPKVGARIFSPEKAVVAALPKAKETSKPQPITEIKTNESYHVATNETKERTVVTTNKEPQVVMVHRLTGPWRVILDTGDEYTMENGLQEITKRDVTIMGKRYKYARPLPSTEPIAPPAPVVVQNPSYVEESKPAVEVIIFGKRTEPQSFQGWQTRQQLPYSQ